MSVDLLKSISENGTKYSSLLSNKKLLSEFNTLDNLTIELNSLVAKGFLTIEIEYDEEEGVDFSIKITDLGKSFLRLNTGEK